jgi:hypothetical protein
MDGVVGAAVVGAVVVVVAAAAAAAVVEPNRILRRNSLARRRTAEAVCGHGLPPMGVVIRWCPPLMRSRGRPVAAVYMVGVPGDHSLR